jgi:hypothetical protein
MEPHFGSSVVGRARLHTSSESADAASTLGAKAFTDGDHVHFGGGEFQPGTKEGDRLLARELSHVADGGPTVSRKEDPAAKLDAAGPDVSRRRRPSRPPPSPPDPWASTKAKAGDKELPVEPGTAVEVVEDTGEKMKVKLLYPLHEGRLG